MAQVSSSTDFQARQNRGPNPSQALQPKLGINQPAVSQVPSTGGPPRPTPPLIPRKPIPLQSPNGQLPQGRCSNPFRNKYLQESAIAPVTKSSNPFRPVSLQHTESVSAKGPSSSVSSVGHTHSVSSDNTTKTSPVFIGVVGVTGSGKSTFIRRVTGCENVEVFHGLRSGTKHVNQASLYIGSVTVNLVDTPGFNDTDLDDEEVCDLLIDWLKDFHNKRQRFSGLIYMHPINKSREKGSDVRSLKIFKKLVGRENLESIVIGLTFYDVEHPNIAASREQELRNSADFWADFIATGTTVVRIPPDRDGCLSLIANMAKKKTMTLQVERELFEENRTAGETSAKQEMQGHEELKMVRLKEEMQQATQQLLFEERVKLNSQLAAERTALEQQLFEERQARQLLEEEVLMWKTACEKEKEDTHAIKLQHDREEELRRQKTEQEKREKRTKEEREKNEKALKEIEEKKDIDYAKSQMTKIRTYDKSKLALLTTYLDSADYSKVQPFQLIAMAKGFTFVIGGLCRVCWLELRPDEPVLLYHPNSPDTKWAMDVCTSEHCLSVAKRLVDHSLWKPRWDFPLLTSILQCKRFTQHYTSLVCSTCYMTGKKISGYYWHCCECDDDDFDLCMECWAIQEFGCREKDNHLLKLAFFCDPDARYQIQR